MGLSLLQYIPISEVRLLNLPLQLVSLVQYSEIS